MSRLTVDERRRANELRRVGTTRAPRAVTLEDMEQRGATHWGRSARVATLVTLAVGGALAVIQLGQTLSLYGPGSVLDWLLPRL